MGWKAKIKVRNGDANWVADHDLDLKCTSFSHDTAHCSCSKLVFLEQELMDIVSSSS